MKISYPQEDKRVVNIYLDSLCQYAETQLTQNPDDFLTIATNFSEKINWLQKALENWNPAMKDFFQVDRGSGFTLQVPI